jgi:hypothetical protein
MTREELAVMADDECCWLFNGADGVFRGRSASACIGTHQSGPSGIAVVVAREFPNNRTVLGIPSHTSSLIYPMGVYERGESWSLVSVCLAEVGDLHELRSNSPRSSQGGLGNQVVRVERGDPRHTRSAESEGHCDCQGIWRILTVEQIGQKYAHVKYQKHRDCPIDVNSAGSANN